MLWLRFRSASSTTEEVSPAAVPSIRIVLTHADTVISCTAVSKGCCQETSNPREAQGPAPLSRRKVMCPHPHFCAPRTNVWKGQMSRGGHQGFFPGILSRDVTKVGPRMIRCCLDSLLLSVVTPAQTSRRCSHPHRKLAASQRYRFFPSASL